MSIFSSLHKGRLPKIQLPVVVLLIAGCIFASFAPAYADLVPDNKISTAMEGFNLTGPYSVVGGTPTADGGFQNGNVGGYPEGSCIPTLISVKNNDTIAGDIDITPYFDYQQGGILGITTLKEVTSTQDPKTVTNLNQLTFTSKTLDQVTSFATNGGSSVNAIITGAFSGDAGVDPVTPTDKMRHFNVLLQNVPADTTVYVLFCAQLDVQASQFPGASLSLRAKKGGNENIAIPSSQILSLPSLTLTKVVASGDAAPDAWSFHVTPAINGMSDFDIPAGQDTVVIDNIPVDGTYTVTEFGGPSGYVFQSGTGSNCSFTSETGSEGLATVAAGSPQATNASCTFTNALAPFVQTTSTLRVIKHVINDDTGTSTASDFTMQVTGGNPSTSTFPGSETGTDVIIDAETAYSVDEVTATGYTKTLDGCSGMIAAGETKTCTITNDDIAGDPTGNPSPSSTLIIIKQVINDGGGTMDAGSFVLHVNANGASNVPFHGNSAGTHFDVGPGDFSVTENSYANYSASFSADCSGSFGITAETKTCTVTNTYISSDTEPTTSTATLIVIKNVINDNNGEAYPWNFVLNATGTNISQTSFNGSSTGIILTLDPGSYQITEDPQYGYTATFSSDCSGTIAAGESRRCLVINNDPEPVATRKATLIVQKLVTNDDGGAKNSGDFLLTATGTNISLTSFLGDANGTTLTLDAGSYQVNEDDPAGYTKSLDANCSGTIAAGETKTCVVRNNDTAQGNSTNGGGGGGGSGSIIPNIPATPTTGSTTPSTGSTTPSGSVLGASTEDPGVATTTAPTPRVLGDSTEELPRTGLPGEALALLLLPLALLLRKPSQQK